jgi:uncharacterized protein YvpB
MEFLIVFGFATAMLLPLIIIFFIQSNETKDTLNSAQIANIGTKIIDKAESIYYLGEPSRTTLKVVFPEGIESITINNREITFNFRNYENTLQEISLTSLVNITGNLSHRSGLHYIVIEAKGGSVSMED